MNPGLPGLGIGGLYYILSALAMPLFALAHVLRRSPQSRWRLALRQCVIALGIAASMSLAFWALDLVYALRAQAHLASATHPSWHTLRISAMLLTACVLSTVLGSMHVVRLVARGQDGADPRRVLDA
jgi:hypothetical protein